MSFTTDLQKSYADHVYKGLKAKIPVATAAMAAEAPVRSGLLRDNTYCFLKPESNDEVAVLKFVASPPRSPRYKGHSRKRRKGNSTKGKTTGENEDRGSAHAQFSNARGSSKGWWDDRALPAGLAVFLS